MDIGSLCTSETAECVIKDPKTGADTDIKITVYGSDSRQFRKVVKAQAKAAVAAKAEGRDMEDSIEKDAEYLADLTEGWEGVQMGGKELKFSRENAIKVYTASAIVRNQVNHFITRQSNFLPKA